MDRSDRLIVLAVMIAIAAWRLARYLRLGMSKRRPSLGIAGGVIPPSSDIGATTNLTSGSPDRSAPPLLLFVSVAVTVAIWCVGNFLIWIALFQLPFLRNLPPILLGIAWVFANFYLIPFARHSGKRCAERIGIARAGGRAQ